MYRAIKSKLGKYAFGRPQLDLSKTNWANTIDKAFGKKLSPPFDPYANSLNYLISIYTIPYVGLTGYVGTIPLLEGVGAKSVSSQPMPQLIARALAVEYKYSLTLTNCVSIGRTKHKITSVSGSPFLL